MLSNLMRPSLLAAVVTLLLVSGLIAPAQAQLRLYAGASVGYARGETPAWHGASTALSAAVQWKRLLAHVHVADLALEREDAGFTLTEDRTEVIDLDYRWDFDFGFALDLSYVQPLTPTLDVTVGLGQRFRDDDFSGPTDGLAETPYVQIGTFVGPRDGLRWHGRLETSLNGITRAHLGVLVPLRF